MEIYNSLSKKKETFTPIHKGKVGLYSCGPTVYDYVHVGNLRSFMLSDFVRRTMEYQGYEVLQVMNITDIGHLVSDGDHGDDKMTKALRREGKSITLENMLKIADFYAERFKEDLLKLNVLTPHHLPKASDHIFEDIEIIKSLENKGYAYSTSDGVYFDISKMPDYGKLGGVQTDDHSESRIEITSEKRNSADFALWKFDDTNGWQSPWGQGFPGWHIECSGMSIKYLGDQFDIHTGGSDLRTIHHNNEIAQSECSTGHAPFVNYWMHGEMLNLGGAKLSKSTGGNITLATLHEKGFSPIDYRYLAIQTHYRSPMNFTWDILQSAHNGLENMYRDVIALRKQSETLGTASPELQSEFLEKLGDDMNIPQATALLHSVFKSTLSVADKLATIYDFDRVLGLGLADYNEKIVEISPEIQTLLDQRQRARDEDNWGLSDSLRNQIVEQGFGVLDTPSGQEIQLLD
jgi:cysteinyl-tRNA synthetase